MKANQKQVHIMSTFPSINTLNYINSFKGRRTFTKFAKAGKDFYSILPFIFRLVEQKYLLINYLQSTRREIRTRVNRPGLDSSEVEDCNPYNAVPSQSFFPNYLDDEKTGGEDE